MTQTGIENRLLLSFTLIVSGLAIVGVNEVRLSLGRGQNEQIVKNRWANIR